MAVRIKPLKKIQALDLLDPNEMSNYILAKVREDLEELRLRDSELYKNLATRINDKKSSWFLQVILPNYAKWVDGGRRPGNMPPVGAILSWLRRKGLKPKRGSLGQFAWAIAKSISKRGIKPRPFIKNISVYSLEFTEANMQAAAQYLADGVANEIRKTVKKSIYLKAK